MRALRVGVYDLYWSTYGGGEQVDGTIAQVLAEDGHDVTLLGPRPPDVERTRERLGVDLSRVRLPRRPRRRLGVGRQRRLRRVRERHLPESRRQPGRARLLLRPLPAGACRAGSIESAIGRTSVPSRASGRCRSRELPLRLREVQAGFDRRIARTHFIPSYRRFLANSTFTAEWVERLWGVVADVLVPTGSSVGAAGGEARRSCSASVGSSTPFTATARSSSTSSTRSSRWSGRVLPMGGSWRSSAAVARPTASTRSPCKRAAIGHRVEVHINAPGRARRAAARRGVDLLARRRVRRGSRAGTRIASSTSASPSSRRWPPAPRPSSTARPDRPRSCVTVSTAITGGPARELIAITTRLMHDPEALRARGEAARRRTDEFSAARFTSELLDFVSRDCQS